jgi:TPR repeat protein
MAISPSGSLTNVHFLFFMHQSMKTKRCKFYLLAAILFVGIFQLKAADSTNTTTTVQENWETISNRWGSVPPEKIKQTAEKGDVTAQYYLAIAYSDGNGVTTNQDEAFKWMQFAAQQGMARAQRNLGGMLQDGLGTATNEDEAVVWYRKAAQQSDAEAQMKLGWMYENGVGVSQDYSEAIRLFRLAADQGNALAQSNLGWIYDQGLGVPQSIREAVNWYQKAAEQGELFAEKKLASIYAGGRYGEITAIGQGAAAQVRSGGIAPNHELAEKWMRQALDLNTAEGQYQFGDLLYSEVNKDGHQDTNSFPAAAEWFRKAAEQGLAKAQYQLADMYNSGDLGNDQRSNCIPWFLKAAAQGNAEAQAEVGELPKYYPNSELLKSVNPVEALRQSAEQGNLDAQFQLAQRYQTGHGVPKDPTEAFKWMQKAAQNDTLSSKVGDATYNLALMYEKGEGVTQDLSEAHNLFFQAATNSPFLQPDAMFRVGQMYENGDGVPQDDRKAAEFYANKFHSYNYPDKYPNGFVEYGGVVPESLFNLWAQGRGFPNDKDKAEPGYREPSDLIKDCESYIKTAKAAFYLGEIYYQGRLVPQDLVEADARLRLAANQNLDDARKILDELEPKMSPAQIEAAKSRFDILEKQFEQQKANDESLKKIDQRLKEFELHTK